MAKRTQGIDAVRRVRRLLAEWLEGDRRDPARAIAEILRLTDAIEDELRAAPPPRGGRVVGSATRYTVDKTPAGEVLTEHRLVGMTPPFRVPRMWYDAVAQALAEAGRPLRFAELMERVRARAGAPIGDFQARACLRFWQTTKPPLVARNRSEYWPLTKSFLSDAKKAWAAMV